MDATAQWPLENIGVRDMTRTSCDKVGGEKAAPPPQKQQGLNCPRCNSTNTKFCYYNNYSLSQPRYFCKTCRRYWTSGGTLRNIPVGGGSRKNKRPSASPTTTSSKHTKPNPPDHRPNLDLRTVDGHDLNLTFSRGFTMTPPGYVGPTQDLMFASGMNLNPPVLNFDGFGLGAGGSTFTFQDLKHQAPSAIDGQDPQSGDGYWSGVLGGGGAW